MIIHFNFTCFLSTYILIYHMNVNLFFVVVILFFLFREGLRSLLLDVTGKVYLNRSKKDIIQIRMPRLHTLHSLEVTPVIHIRHPHSEARKTCQNTKRQHTEIMCRTVSISHVQKRFYVY
jgi:hypothetical protein